MLTLIDQHREFACYHGITLKAMHWQHPRPDQAIIQAPVLALHGWMDNAASYTPIAPLLACRELIALDLSGHGLSDHRGAGAQYTMPAYVEDVYAMTRSWSNFHLLGHSLGAGVACMVAGTLTNQVLSLALIEGLGALSSEADQAAENLRAYLEQSSQTRPLSDFSDFESGVKARMNSPFAPLSNHAAKLLAERAVFFQGDSYRWGMDHRLKNLSAFRLTEEMVIAFLSNIQCPSTLIIGESGIIQCDDRKVKRRLKAMGVTTDSIHTLPGGHHLHMEESVEPVAEQLNSFWQTCKHGE